MRRRPPQEPASPMPFFAVLAVQMSALFGRFQSSLVVLRSFTFFGNEQEAFVLCAKNIAKTYFRTFPNLLN